MQGETKTMTQKIWAFMLALAAMPIAVLWSGSVQAQQRSFDVPAQEATKSIPEFARQAGIQISAPSERLKGMRTPAIRGALTTDEALGKLLEGTGLTYLYLDRNTIAIQVRPVARAARDDIARVAQGETTSGGSNSPGSTAG